MYYVVYNNEMAMWVLKEEYNELIKRGFKLYSYAFSEEEADQLTEEACYI